MFGIGTPELLLILAVALIVIGPKKLPDLAKSMGRAMGEFKRATSDLKQSLEQETGLDEVRDHLKEVKQDLLRPQAPVDPGVANASPADDEPESTSDADSAPRKIDPLNDNDEEKPSA